MFSRFISFKAKKNKQRRTATSDARAIDKPPPKKQRPPSESKGTVPSYQKKPAHVRQSTEIFRTHAFGVQDPRVTPSYAFVTGPPYLSWSQYLSHDFDLPVYNEFRRLALDDVFTRHNNYGFKALMSFYRSCLLSCRPLPDEVISDIVHLASAGNSECHATVYELLSSILSGGKMEDNNCFKAGVYFDREFGDQKQC